MSPRSWLRSWLPNHTRTPARRHRTRLTAEHLEAREVPATLSVADATLSEIGSPSAFVSASSGGLDRPFGITLGPDGNVYVAGNGGAVRRYDGTTGQYISTFVSQGSGGLSDVYGLAFGPDGNLYVASGATDQILRYNGTTGAFMNAFVPAGSGGLDLPRGLTFGPDGNLYVSSNLTHSILRYQGPLAASPGSPLPSPGQPGATFVDGSSGSLNRPLHLIFGPDGNSDGASDLYVDGNHNGIARFSGTTGAFLDTFVPDLRGDLAMARAMAFDSDGQLYVTDSGNGLHRYDRQGNFLGDLLVNSVSYTLNKPHGLVFDAQGALLISCRDSDAIVRYDRGVVVSLSAASSTPVTVDYATLGGTASAATDYYAQSGTVTFQPGQTSRRVLLATRDDLDAEPTETFSVQLSSPTGATIGTGSATVTTVDEDATRQVSVVDTAATEGDHTVHYRGAFIETFPGNGGFYPVTFADGILYAQRQTGPGANSIDRYDAATGAHIDTLVQPDGHISSARGIALRDGYLYVSSFETHNVLRYNATTGAFVDVFVAPGSGGIVNPNNMAFGPDFNGDLIPELYVTSEGTNSVVRFDGLTGQPLGTYIAPGSGGLALPVFLTFHPNGSVYVASYNTSQVLKYNALTGAFAGVAASGSGLSNPQGVEFGPDGLMYVTSYGNNRIMRFTLSGTYVDDYVPAGSNGQFHTTLALFGPDGDLYVADETNQIKRYGTESEALFTVAISTPSTLPVTVEYTTANGTALAGSDYTPVSGTVTFEPGVTSKIIRVPLLDDAAAESAETFSLILSNPVGAVIADGTGVGTITDDDSTKFFVADDGTSTDRTYRYGALGNAQTNTSLGSGNTQPRGAASTAAGDKVWVVDANKNVYVYNAAGALLGSWSAGGLPKNSSVEGITTNGTDVWVLANNPGKDKVFRYAGAASRLSGTQSVFSSFGLASGDTNPKDIVTDGTSIWVVDDGSTDKVFKYTLSGSSLGSWTMTGGGAAPTGITLDPSAPAHLWVVDSGTDRVYQFDNAVSRTSGSQAASASFALAAGNTNPQGIADPPAPSQFLPATPAGWLGRSSRGPAPGLASAPADAAGHWLPPDGYDFAPIDVSTPRGRAKRT